MIFLIFTDDTTFTALDIRNGTKCVPLYELRAHVRKLNSMSLNPRIPGFLVTCGNNKGIKIWNLNHHHPNLLLTNNLGAGPYCFIEFCPLQPHLLAAGGKKSQLSI